MKEGNRYSTPASRMLRESSNNIDQRQVAFPFTSANIHDNHVYVSFPRCVTRRDDQNPISMSRMKLEYTEVHSLSQYNDAQYECEKKENEMSMVSRSKMNYTQLPS